MSLAEKLAEQDEAGLIVERDRLQAENAKLWEVAKEMHEALRENFVQPATDGTDGDDNGDCSLCVNYWVGSKEVHKPECLCRPDALEDCAR